MSDTPFIPFYPSDWLAGTRGMSAQETGIYITLIAMMYERKGPLKEDFSRLARLCNCRLDAFKKAIKTLEGSGKIIREGDGLFNERVKKELLRRKNRSAKASASAVERWKKDKQKQKGDDKIAMRSQCVRNANHNHNTISKDIDAHRGEPPDRSIRQRLFSDGVASLRRQTGKREDQCRSLIGKWLKATNDDVGLVLASIRQSEADSVADAVPWLEACFKPKPKVNPLFARM